MMSEPRLPRQPVEVETPLSRDIRARFSGLAAAQVDLMAGAASHSPYLAGLMLREDEWIGAGGLDEPEGIVARETAGAEDLAPDRLADHLRQAKRRVALATALADLSGRFSVLEVTRTLTELADRATDLALRAHLRREIERGKMPPCAADAGGMIVLAMGKMGAFELNYSSDIDLIVLFDDEAYDEQDLAEARAGLIRVTRRMAATLSDVTAQGYVFRTDLRLRPDASVTPVCLSSSAALAYYEAEGRTWERAAYIKARPCAVNIEVGQRFLDALRPFVWRKHLDFAAIQDAHDMRLRIRDHKGLGGRLELPGHDMKLGKGGIREIEFFTQTRQLIAGGRDPELRARGTTEALAALARKGWIGEDQARILTEHYLAHRRVEHAVQMVNDAQTHRLPRDPEALESLARLLGSDDPQGWAQSVERRLVEVARLTDDFFAPDDVAELPPLTPETEEAISRWNSYPALKSERARQLFRRILPKLLERLEDASDSAEALARFDGFLAGLPAGVQLFSLFDANPHLVDLIVDICATAPRLASYLSRHSNVLDAVIGGDFFAPWPGVAALRAQLSARLARAMEGQGGYEASLDDARRWAHELQFRVGVHHLRGLIDALEAGQAYAEIAEATLHALFPHVVEEFSRRHGTPPGRGAILLGMGSLGAGMLNAGSDLDLMVIYDSGEAVMSEGSKPLSVRPYYARLTQAMITAVTALTAHGRLYEVDMRLRPSGRQGPVATSIESFESYQRHEAWTWEHLALTRARIVGLSGAGSLAENVEGIRRDILQEASMLDRIDPDLEDMRGRLFAAKPARDGLDAKRGPGGMQDIELFAQRCALVCGAGTFKTEAQLRSAVRSGVLGKAEAELLLRSYRLLWRVNAAARLLSDEALDPARLGANARQLLLSAGDVETIEDLIRAMAETKAGAKAVIDARLLSSVESSVSG